ncbi:uncharacterized protein LOC115068913 isoform X2 [Nannospalax galili]|uniref:uncharacterized protein LOC115068913 isoform X2 n=1 Tax=Nannospalax galili TaxID=1026970 RepID=UPI00111C4DE1|nr:uncharacterized protein LOC115068913 isoform X2 [Nannospalax galili]
MLTSGGCQGKKLRPRAGKEGFQAVQANKGYWKKQADEKVTLGVLAGRNLFRQMAWGVWMWFGLLLLDTDGMTLPGLNPGLCVCKVLTKLPQLTLNFQVSSFSLLKSWDDRPTLPGLAHRSCISAHFKNWILLVDYESGYHHPTSTHHHEKLTERKGNRST